MAKNSSLKLLLAIAVATASAVMSAGSYAGVAVAEASMPAGSHTATAQTEPGRVVEMATNAVMAVVAEAPTYVDADPERYYAAIGAELDKVVDFRGFARGVMGEYASKSRYGSLDAAGRETLKTQLNAFSEVIRENLIQTYAKGLLAFGGSRVELSATQAAPGSARVASVTQLVYGDQDRIYTVRYQMGQYADGHWMLRNMIIENINLGEIYQGQFEAAAKAANGDLDLVIAEWNVAAEADGQES